MEEMESGDYQAHLDHQETKETKDHLDHGEREDYMAPLELLVPKVKRAWEPKGKQPSVEEQCMYAGGGPLVQLARELNYYTMEEVQGVALISQEVGLTISVCQMIPNTCSMQEESRDTAIYMEWNIDLMMLNIHYTMLMKIMFPALCAIFQHESQR